MYMLGQSSSSIEDQIKFFPARHDDLVNLTQKVKTEEDVEVKKMRWDSWMETTLQQTLNAEISMEGIMVAQVVMGI